MNQHKNNMPILKLFLQNFGKAIVIKQTPKISKLIKAHRETKSIFHLMAMSYLKSIYITAINDHSAPCLINIEHIHKDNKCLVFLSQDHHFRADTWVLQR